MCNVKSKKCTKCGENKPLTDFHRHRTKKDGLCSQCKSCRNEKSRNYRQENREALNEIRRNYYQKNKEAEKERDRKYYQENKGTIKERTRKYYQENREAIKEKKRNYYQENKRAINERSRNYRQENREALNERKRKYYEENREAEKERRRNYYQENKEAENERHNKYHKERYATDPQFRTLCLLRHQTQRLGDFKNTNTIELIGCSANEFWLMNGSPTIEELQELHIDHIVPMSWFDISNDGHVKVCNHYLNLQYLSSADNLSKGDRYAGSPNNMLAYKGEFDVDAYVSDTLKKIENLHSHTHKNYNICQF